MPCRKPGRDRNRPEDAVMSAPQRREFLGLIEIIKTAEQAAEERKQRQETARKLMEENTCPYCKDYSHVSWTLEYASDTNPLIPFFASIGAMKNKQRRVYECQTCGAMWKGEWYEC